MATLYNKTALNKIKKADLIQMFLDQQAKLNDIKMEAEEMNQKGWLEIAKREEEHKKLKEENDEWKEVAGVEGLETPSELESWMSASIHEDDEVYSKYMEPLELRDENEKLKDTIVSLKSSVDDLREARDMRDLKIKRLTKEIGYNDTKIERQNWQLDYAYKQLNELMSKATLLKDEIESKEESDSESEEEEDECVCCGTNFDQHEARYNEGEDLRLKYQKYFGSENDDGDICPECLDKIY